MTIQRSDAFKRDYGRLPSSAKLRVERQVGLLVTNRSHPSLRLKKMALAGDIWEARVSEGYRMTLQFLEDMIFLGRVGTHDLLCHP